MIMRLKIEGIFIKLDVFVLHPPISPLLDLVPGSLSQRGTGEATATAWESGAFHGWRTWCCGEEAVTAWVPADQNRGRGAAKAGGTLLPEPNPLHQHSTDVCETSLLR